MIFVHPEIDYEFDTTGEKVNTIIIENPQFFCRIVNEIYRQTEGDDGKAVVSKNGKIIDLNKNVELLTSFVPFEINRKSIVSKINTEVEKSIISGEKYLKMTELLAQIESLIEAAAFEYNCNIELTKMSVGSIIKAVGITVCDDYDSLAEKVLDYMELVRDFEADKLFITVDLRDYLSDKEMGEFLETIISHQYNLIMIESHERQLLPAENRLVIDSDLCIIKK